MKRFGHSLLRAACAFALGLVLVLFPGRAAEYLVVAVGCLFVIPSLVSIAVYVAGRSGGAVRFPFFALGSLLFGIWLAAMPGFFADMLTYVLGFVLALGGMQQVAALTAARVWMRVPAVFYVAPVLIMASGLVALFNPVGTRSTLFVIAGAGCLVYALAEVVNWLRFSRRRPKTPGTADAGDVEDAEIVD